MDMLFSGVTSMLPLSLRRAVRRSSRLYREVRTVALGLKSAKHPVLAHVCVIRRCNLACTYCSEFDDFSKPVPTGELLKRIDRLAELGTTSINLTGGEPLLHPDIEGVIAHVRKRGILAVMVTNGYLLNVAKVEKLNRSGLDRLQISVDNIKPDDVSKKSLKILDQKLRWLSEHAEFTINIHSVVGAGTENPADALAIAQRAEELGLISTVGIVHDAMGRLMALGPEHVKVIASIDNLRKPVFSFARHNPWRSNLMHGQPNEWHCGAGGRHLYICEDGLVHYCMAQRGYPAVPLAQYTQADIVREMQVKKDCAPLCTIGCIQRIALLDEIRENPRKTLIKLFPAENGESIPVPVRLLTNLLDPSRSSSMGRIFTKAALKVLNIQ